MPPKYPPIPPQVPIRRPEEEPTEPNDAHDVLCVMDIVDVLDALPIDLTKTLADLRELDAVLNGTVNHLGVRLTALTEILTNKTASPSDRFQLLLEIAEELTRFKLGGEDKIRVAGVACESLVAGQHQVHELISSSTLLLRQPIHKPTHLISLASTHKRHRNSPMPARTLDGVMETPSKKKKRTLHSTLAVAASVDEGTLDEEGEGLKSPALARKTVGAKDKKTQKVKASAANRTSPADSLDQVAAGSSRNDGRGETPVGRAKETARASPGPSNLFIGATAADEPGPRPAKAARGGAKRAKNGSVAESSRAVLEAATGGALVVEVGGGEFDENGVELETDHQLYCSCQKGSYGEMIACDGEECPYEWFHLACTGLAAPPVGDWLCQICSDRKASKAAAAKAKRGKAAPKFRSAANYRK